MKRAIQVAAGAVIGNMVAEMFVLKASPEDPGGFVVVSEGIGMDDFARAALIAAATLLVMKVS